MADKITEISYFCSIIDRIRGDEYGNTAVIYTGTDSAQ